MFLQEDGRIVLNEVNTLPGFTTYSRYPRMMAAAGLGLSERDRPAHLVGDGAVSMERGFVFLDEVLSGVRWDAKYATWDNFTGKPVEGYEVNRIVGSYALAGALLEAKLRAAALGFGLLLWDGYRPQRAVDRFLEWSAQPEDGRTKERFYPNIDRAEMFSSGYVAPRSGHSRGSAVDLTLYRLDTGEVAAMGGGHDLMDERSHHGATGVSGAEAENRRSLCSLMEASGFEPYEREWWHYVLTRRAVPRHLLRLPHPVGGADVGRARASAAPEEEVGHPASRTRYHVELEPVEQVLVGRPEPLAALEVHRCDGDVHRVDEVGVQELAHRRHAATEAHVLAVGSLLRPTQRFLGRGVHEVERRVRQRERWTHVVGEHEHGRVERWLVAPPALPRPRPPTGRAADRTCCAP